jgi:ankyrin repeat protein
MDLKNKILAIALMCFGLFCAMDANESLAQRVTRNDDWVLNTSYGFPVWIAFNDLIGGRREIFIYIEPQVFSHENMRRLFTALATEYKTPDWLDVTAFSDKLMLQRAINNATAGMFIDWADTPEGKAAGRKWAEEHDPLPTGYYRARYFRIGRRNYSRSYIEERYSYSPDPAKPEMISVVLQDKPRGSPYSGEINADLLIAAREGDAAKVGALVGNGANVDSRREDGSTALMIAALSARDLATVKVLLAKGADVNARNKKNDTALIYAASNDNAEMTRALLDKCANINHQNDNGYSALIMASVSKLRLRNATLLLERGANLELKNDRGETALIMAAGYGVVELVRALLEKGANVDARDEKGNTALLRAAGERRAEIIGLLAEKGADVNARNEDGVTAIMLARTKETARLLLDKGADVNARNNDGDTALIHAARWWWSADAAAVLLEGGADVAAKNKKGETALSIANMHYGNNNALLDVLEDAEQKVAIIASSAAGSKSAKNDNDHPQMAIKRDPLAGCCEEVSSVAFSPDGKLIASKLYHSAFAGNQGILVWDASTGKLVKTIEGPRNGVIPIMFSPDGREIASESGQMWNLESGKLTTKTGTAEELAGYRSVYSAAWSPDGKVIASAEKKIGERTKITIRDSSTGTALRTFATPTDVQDLRFSGDGKILVGVIRNPNNTLLFWDAISGEVRRSIVVVDPGFYSVAYRNDGAMVAASAGEIVKNDRVDVFDPSTGKIIYSLDEHSVVFSLAFSPDNKLLATGSGDTTIKLWDAATGKLLRTMDGHSKLVRSVVFSPDGRLLASGGGSNEIKIWSVSTGKLLVTLVAFNDGNWIAYTPDGYYNCSEQGAKYLSWRVANRPYNDDALRSQYFKPEIVAARLRD